MLVLTRKIGERTMIGEMIVLTVLRASSRRVRLGIEAPPDMTVRREELFTSQEPDPTSATPRGKGNKPR